VPDFAANTPLRWAVTGASGFVGRHLLDWLTARGVEAVALSRRGVARPGVRDVVIPDYADAAPLVSALTGVDALVHLAARAHQRPAAGDDLAAFHDANVESVLTVARACQAAKVRRLVLISSIGVYGERSPAGRPFTEQHEPRPAAAYAKSKLEAEHRLADLLRGQPVEHVILQPPLVYGVGAPGNFAQLLGFVQRLPLVPLGGLHRQRSLIHVDNLCSAIELACMHPDIAGRRFVLCDGDDVSVAQIARELVTGLGRNPRCVVNVPEGWLRRMASMLARGAAVSKLADELRVDASAFRTATGWLPPRRVHEALRATAAAARDA
jgi:UDP-4-keto-D-FucNAc 4-reductase